MSILLQIVACCDTPGCKRSTEALEQWQTTGPGLAKVLFPDESLGWTVEYWPVTGNVKTVSCPDHREPK